jgi:hypothetical protein
MRFYQVSLFHLHGESLVSALELRLLLLHPQLLAVFRESHGILFRNPHKFFMCCLRYCC